MNTSISDYLDLRKLNYGDVAGMYLSYAGMVCDPANQEKIKPLRLIRIQRAPRLINALPRICYSVKVMSDARRDAVIGLGSRIVCINDQPQFCRFY